MTQEKFEKATELNNEINTVMEFDWLIENCYDSNGNPYRIYVMDNDEHIVNELLLPLELKSRIIKCIQDYQNELMNEFERL